MARFDRGFTDAKPQQQKTGNNKSGGSKPTPQAQRMTTGSGSRSRSMSGPIKTSKG